MYVRLLVRSVFALSLVVTAGCGAHTDLTAALEITDLSSGYYDNGIKDGAHHLLPSVRFKVRNVSDREIRHLQLTVQFWGIVRGREGELDARLFSGITIPAGGETDEILVRSGLGYTLENPDITGLFDHGRFNDFDVRVFARQSGAIVRIGQGTVERRILPASGRP